MTKAERVVQMAQSLPKQMKPASNKTASRNQNIVKTLTDWLESSPDSNAHRDSLERMATGSRYKETNSMLEYLLANLESTMPENLPPEEMFGFLERQFSETHSEGDHYGPER